MSRGRESMWRSNRWMCGRFIMGGTVEGWGRGETTKVTEDRMDGLAVVVAPACFKCYSRGCFNLAGLSMADRLN